MKHLLIIGARGFGREVYHSAIDSIGYGKVFDIKGYLDDKQDALDGFEGYPPIIGPVEAYQPEGDDVFVCALGDVNWKKHYVQIIEQKGGNFISLIHNTAYVAPTAKLGKGCLLLAGARLQSDALLGNFVTMQPYSLLAHDLIAGDFCHFNCNAFTGGGVVIGEMVTVHTGGMVMPHIHIGDDAVVGAGCVVSRDVPSNMTVFGNPCRILPLVSKEN